MAIINVLLSRRVNRHGNVGIVESAITRCGPVQVVVIHGVTHNLGFTSFANGHIITSSAGHHTLGGQANEVDPCAVAATSSVLVFGIGPFVGVSSSRNCVCCLGPIHITRPIALFLAVDIEVQLVVAIFRRHLIIEGDAVVCAGLMGQKQGGASIVADAARFGAVLALVWAFGDDSPRGVLLVPAFAESTALEILNDKTNLGDVVILFGVLA